MIVALRWTAGGIAASILSRPRRDASCSRRLPSGAPGGRPALPRLPRLLDPQLADRRVRPLTLQVLRDALDGGLLVGGTIVLIVKRHSDVRHAVLRLMGRHRGQNRLPRWHGHWGPPRHERARPAYRVLKDWHRARCPDPQRARDPRSASAWHQESRDCRAG